MKTNKKRITLDLNHLQQTALVGKALSSEVRLEMLKLLIERSANISELAAEFEPPISKSCLNHRLRKLVEISKT